jgi:DNA-3-methyladenine glycosylase
MDSALADLLSGPVLEVAPRLLGAVVSHDGVAVRLTEVEAYDGQDDPGSHAFRGPTRRNEVMFGPPGHLYVYFTYGMHHCANVVCGPDGRASAVLLRAGEVVEGIETARSRRGSARDRDLARGPARLCSALGLDLGHNGSFLLEALGSPRLELPGQGGACDPLTALEGQQVATGPRVGLRQAADRPWRFWLADDQHVSTYRPAAPLGRRRSR